MKACRSPLPIPTVLSSKEVSALAPELASVTPRGALCWHDLVMTEPHRIHVQLTEQLRSRKTEIREHTRAVAVVKSENGFRVQSGDGLEVEAATIINTLGAWLGSISIPDDLRGPQPKWCLGFNLIVSKQLHPTYACGVQSPDGRLFFCVPRGAHTAIGTWYIPYPATPNTHASGAKPEIPEQAMKDFIASFNRSFPSYQIRTEDICAFDAGVLPMKAERQNGPELFGSEIISSRTGYCEVMSTKYTTFHSQGQRALETVLGNIQKI
jgi:glycerol-3-phosphate dehydrogenase